MFDTHCHFYLETTEKERESAFQDALAHEVTRFLVPGIDYESSIKAVQLSYLHEGSIFAAVGVHPNHSQEIGIEDFDGLIQQSSGHIRAVGEIGLDFYRTYSSKETQIKVLDTMLALANKHQLPVCLHNRDADEELLHILSHWYASSERNNSSTGVFHAFGGSESIAAWGTAHDFYFGVGGLITYKKSTNLLEQVREIGLSRLVLETDSPYMAPVPHRGKKNTPANLIYVANALSSCLNVSVEDVIASTNRNAQRLFGFNQKNA